MEPRESAKVIITTTAAYDRVAARCAERGGIRARDVQWVFRKAEAGNPKRG